MNPTYPRFLPHDVARVIPVNALCAWINAAATAGEAAEYLRQVGKELDKAKKCAPPPLMESATNAVREAHFGKLATIDRHEASVANLEERLRTLLVVEAAAWETLQKARHTYFVSQETPK